MKTMPAVVAFVIGTAVLVPAQQPPASAGPADPALVADLVSANRIVAEEGIVDGFGHISVRHNRNPQRFLMARAVAPGLVTADDLIEYDLAAAPVNLNGRAQYAERFIHASIYAARPDVMAIVHDHSPAVVPFTVTKTPLRPVYHMAAFMGDALPIYEVRDTSGMSDMLVNSAERGRDLTKALGNRPAVLLRGHGVAVVGPTIPIVVGRSIYLELNARILTQALALGGPITYLDPEESRRMLEAGEHRGYDRAWEAWKQKANRPR
jgi:ribulose-5-phosphate 4-epimerase/fuculose-1-phosphate aldolase